MIMKAMLILYQKEKVVTIILNHLKPSVFQCIQSKIEISALQYIKFDKNMPFWGVTIGRALTFIYLSITD